MAQQNNQQNQQQGPDITMIGKSFVEFYYNLFDNDREKLKDLFRSESYLSFENTGVQGADAIIKHLCTGLKFQKIQHNPKTLDVQPSGNGLLVFVTGSLKVDNEPNAILYSEVFQLIPTDQKASSFWVHNCVFRLNYS